MNATAEHPREVVLDALALIGLAYRGDLESGNLLLSTYNDPAERVDLFHATIANAVCILRHVSEAAGVDPEKVLGAAAQEIRGQS